MRNRIDWKFYYLFPFQQLWALWKSLFLPGVTPRKLFSFNILCPIASHQQDNGYKFLETIKCNVSLWIWLLVGDFHQLLTIFWSMHSEYLRKMWKFFPINKNKICLYVQKEYNGLTHLPGSKCCLRGNSDFWVIYDHARCQLWH